jgi:epsilon-lactone hydrolase
MLSSKKASVSQSLLLTHTITPEDAAAMTAMRAAVLPFKVKLQGIAAREPFNEIMERVSPPEGVAFHADTVGGVSGFWCKPSNARSGEAILHLHGGWFIKRMGGFGSRSSRDTGTIDAAILVEEREWGT